MAIYLSTSPARRAFKKLLGQANHLIITALVGLYVIKHTAENEKKTITDNPEELYKKLHLEKLHEELHAKWSPRDPVASAERSRRLILDMALIRSVDALDIYIRLSNRKPFLIQSPKIRSEIDQVGRSVYGKFSVLDPHFLPEEKILSALVALMINWRNQAAHMGADEELKDCYKKSIRENKEEIEERFRGLDSDILLDGYNEERKPTFKEIASFINATHQVESQMFFQRACLDRSIERQP